MPFSSEVALISVLQELEYSSSPRCLLPFSEERKKERKKKQEIPQHKKFGENLVPPQPTVRFRQQFLVARTQLPQAQLPVRIVTAGSRSECGGGEQGFLPRGRVAHGQECAAVGETLLLFFSLLFHFASEYWRFRGVRRGWEDVKFLGCWVVGS